MEGLFNVKDTGAMGDGIRDDADSIRISLSQAAKKGGVVWFPPGKYLLGSTLEITNQVILDGVGWSGNPDSNGSWLYVKNSEVTALSLQPGGRGTIIRNLAIMHEQQVVNSGWHPTDYPFAIETSADDVYLYNLFLLNPNRGIAIRNKSGSVGRVSLERIYGQPLREGILVDNALDVVKIRNVHFWPFWSQNQIVMDYLSGNAEAIISLRNDNPHFSDVFILGYKYGFRFGSSSGGSNTGITSKFRIANGDCDFCGVGVQVDGDGTTGQLVNFTAQGQVGAPAGLRVETNNVKLQASNIRLSEYAGNGIRVEGVGNCLSLQNTWIENWNTSEKGFPAIEVTGQSSVFLGNGAVFSNGHGATNTKGNVRIDR
jgi:hypothetical protein